VARVHAPRQVNEMLLQSGEGALRFFPVRPGEGALPFGLTPLCLAGNRYA
jgi:hypothetical protein